MAFITALHLRHAECNLQVKCLRVLQYFPLPEDPANSHMLNSTLKRIITGSDVAKNINKNNAQHAIVFEAIGLALALDADPDLLNAGAPACLRGACTSSAGMYLVRCRNTLHLRLLQLQCYMCSMLVRLQSCISMCM